MSEASKIGSGGCGFHISFSFHFNLFIQGKNIQLIRNNFFAMCPVKIKNKNKSKKKNYLIN